jgi:hypothetical protein
MALVADAEPVAPRLLLLDLTDISVPANLHIDKYAQFCDIVSFLVLKTKRDEGHEETAFLLLPSFAPDMTVTQIWYCLR